ncbi:inositol monophosphatase family protein [Propionicicella superfundia]|uniref:inositol monophosphatase family protein n=1 Tax=Propionicicella superfundia TaxID=348582 RepID=UPI0003F61311|nr:inositol monophosphatase [Propionicicella superfundia]
MQTADIADLIVEAAERIILPRYQALGAGEVMEKKPGDYVTVADQQTEVYLTERLRAAYPDAAVLGEEASVTDPSLVEAFDAAGHGWVMDPIDGTKNFVNGSPDFAVMLAETRDGTVERSWIWQPIHRRMYIAERGRGATRNGTPITTAPAAHPFRGVADRRWVGETMGGAASPVRLQAMCAGVDYPLLAEGVHDFMIYRGQNSWDHLPGIGIVTEAGAVARTYEGVDYGPGVHGSYLIVARDDRAWRELRAGAPVPQ